MKTPNRAERGFTLIEIMVVVVIIGLLATLVGPQIWNMFATGSEKIARTKCQQYHDQISLWMRTSSVREVPATLEEVEEKSKDRDGNPIVKVEPDPWGGEYKIRAEGRRFWVYSDGPDGTEGSEDDIEYPKDEDS